MLVSCSAAACESWIGREEDGIGIGGDDDGEGRRGWICGDGQRFSTGGEEAL